METKNKVNEIKVNEVLVVKKKQKPSATYTLTQMKEIGNKLIELELLTEKEVSELNTLREKAKERFYKNL